MKKILRVRNLGQADRLRRGLQAEGIETAVQAGHGTGRFGAASLFVVRDADLGRARAALARVPEIRGLGVSPLRDKAGRAVLALFGCIAVAAGVVGVLGVHATGARVAAVLAGVALVGHGSGLIRVARGRRSGKP